MTTMTAGNSLSKNCLPFHNSLPRFDDTDLDLEKILSRVAEIRSGWSQEEQASRKKMGELRRQQLMLLVQNKAA